MEMKRLKPALKLNAWQKRIFCFALLLFITITIVIVSRIPKQDMSHPVSASHRSFDQGFIYQPYDWTEAAFEEAFQVIGKTAILLVFTLIALCHGMRH